MANDEKNVFGGANPHGLYVPMTEDEQEVLDRLAETQDLEIVIHGWGIVRNPAVSFGDHRVGLVFTLDFHKPATPIPVHFFDLELRVTSIGKTLLRKRYPLEANGNPLMIGAGLSITLSWDIAIDHMAPELVKAIKPGAMGLTTRRLDPVTGLRTVTGNMDLEAHHKRLAGFLDRKSAALEQQDEAKAVKATQAAGYEVKTDADGNPILPDPM